jgi:hypothetical protein
MIAFLMFKINKIHQEKTINLKVYRAKKPDPKLKFRPITECLILATKEKSSSKQNNQVQTKNRYSHKQKTINYQQPAAVSSQATTRTKTKKKKRNGNRFPCRVGKKGAELSRVVTTALI